MEKTAYKKNTLMIFKNLGNDNNPYFKAYHQEAHKLDDGTWETTVNESRYVNCPREEKDKLLSKFTDSSRAIVEAEVYTYVTAKGYTSFWIQNIK